MARGGAVARLSRRWIVAILSSLVAFGGCAAGLWLVGVDAAVALGVAVAPFTVVLTVLGWWAARADQGIGGGQAGAARQQADIYTVRIDGGQGVQIGDRNTQHNIFGAPPQK
jgi:hypothetical protein